MEEKMIETFVKRYKNSNDMVTEKRIVEKFLNNNNLSMFRFVKHLGDYDNEICDEFVETLKIK